MRTGGAGPRSRSAEGRGSQPPGVAAPGPRGLRGRPGATRMSVRGLDRPFVLAQRSGWSGTAGRPGRARCPLFNGPAALGKSCRLWTRGRKQSSRARLTHSRSAAGVQGPGLCVGTAGVLEGFARQQVEETCVQPFHRCPLCRVDPSEELQGQQPVLDLGLHCRPGFRLCRPSLLGQVGGPPRLSHHFSVTTWARC